MTTTPDISPEAVERLAARAAFPMTVGEAAGFRIEAAATLRALREALTAAREHAADARLREKAAEDVRVTAVDRATAAEARAEAAEKALRPFAKAGELFAVRGEFNECVYAPVAGPEYNITGDDLRHARAALGREL